jgi:hypothetical protein
MSCLPIFDYYWFSSCDSERAHPLYFLFVGNLRIFFTARKMIPIDLWFFPFPFAEVMVMLIARLLGGWDGLVAAEMFIVCLFVRYLHR